MEAYEHIILERSRPGKGVHEREQIKLNEYGEQGFVVAAFTDHEFVLSRAKLPNLKEIRKAVEKPRNSTHVDWA